MQEEWQYQKFGYIKYVLSYPLSVFLVLFIPTWSITLIASLILGLAKSVSILHLTFMIFILCLLSCSFNFLIASFSGSEQNGGLAATMIAMITSLLSGSFIEITRGGIAEKVSYLFPQRYMVDYAINIENGRQAGLISMIIIITLSIVMIAVGGYKNRRKLSS